MQYAKLMYNFLITTTDLKKTIKTCKNPQLRKKTRFQNMCFFFTTLISIELHTSINCNFPTIVDDSARPKSVSKIPCHHYRYS